MKFAIVYATHDGQAQSVAERIADRITKLGHSATVRSADAEEAAGDIDRADAIVVGGGIRYGRLPSSLVELVGERAFALASRPGALYSVSMSAARDVAPAHKCMAEFEQQTGWVADERAAFAGALRYSRYSPFMRFMMKLIARANEETDTEHDREYTDWRAVDRFAVAFALKAAAPARA